MTTKAKRDNAVKLPDLTIIKTPAKTKAKRKTTKRKPAAKTTAARAKKPKGVKRPSAEVLAIALLISQGYRVYKADNSPVAQVSPSFMWVTKDGRSMPISMMTTSHILNSIEKIERSKVGWRRGFLAPLRLELNNRERQTEVFPT